MDKKSMAINSDKRVIHRFIREISAYEFGGELYSQIIPVDTQAYAIYPNEEGNRFFYVIGDGEHTYTEIRDGKGIGEACKEYPVFTEENLNVIVEGVEEEARERKAADELLQLQIDNEKSTREQIDEHLQQQIYDNDESISEIQRNLTKEVFERKQAVEEERVARTTSDESLIVELHKEVEERKHFDELLDEALGEEIQNREAAINNLFNELKADIDNHANDKENPHQVTKAQIGLGNVDNTSDLDKPISIATQNALDIKVDKVSETNRIYGTDSLGDQTTYDINSFGKIDDVKINGTSIVTDKIASFTLGTMAQESVDDYSTKEIADTLYANINYEKTIDNHIADINNPHSVTKEQVGLGNVDNVADLDKPISTATQNALDEISVLLSDEETRATSKENELESAITSEVLRATQAEESLSNTKLNKISDINKVYGTDSQGDQVGYDIDSFGKVDDVRVGGTSVVTNKIANLGTMASETASNYSTKAVADTLYADKIETEQALAGKQNNLTQPQLDAVNSGITSTFVSQITTNQTNIGSIEEKIPAQASAQNQLTDRNFVNSSIATNTANFIGTFSNISELEEYSDPITNNDYAFVINSLITNDDSDWETFNALDEYNKDLLTNFDYAWVINGSNFDLYRFDIIEQEWDLRASNITKESVTLNTAYNRYKANVEDNVVTWEFEYTLNNSSFTANQWAAINSGATSEKIEQIATNVEDINTINSSAVMTSGITSTKVSNYDTHIADTVIHVTSSDKQTWNAKQNALIAGSNIQIDGDTISATDTTYTAGTGIDITNGVISNTQTSAEWGNITGTLSDQTDLQSALNDKQDVISDLSDIRSGASAGATALQPNDNLSELINDVGYITGISSSDVTTALGYTPVDPSNLATVATTGDYDDLSNKPTIPVVNDATLTITQGGISKGTFTANASSDVTIDLDASVDIDNTTITENASNQLQASAVMNARTGTDVLPIWQGTEQQWTNGVGTDWYNWKTPAVYTRNFSVVGTPTIVDSPQFSCKDFSSSKYLTIQDPGFGSSDSWEFRIHLGLYGWGTLIYSPYKILVKRSTWDNQAHIWLSSNGTSWDICSDYATGSTQLGNDVTIKIGFDGTQYYIKSLDDTYTYVYYNSSTKIISNNNLIQIGAGDGSYWSAYLYFNPSYAYSIVDNDIIPSFYRQTVLQAYTLDSTPTTSSTVYSAPNTASALTITSVGEGTITLSDTNTYTYTQSGDETTYQTIGDAHPTWLCNINGVGVKVGNTLIADYTTLDNTPIQNSTNSITSGAVYDSLLEKLDKVSTVNVVYGTDAQGAQTTYQVSSFGAVDDVQVNGTSIVSNKIANFTVDNAPTQSSTNLVTSGGVYSAIPSIIMRDWSNNNNSNL